MASYSPQLMNPSLTLGVNLLWVKITKNPKYLHVVVHFGSVQKKTRLNIIGTFFLNRLIIRLFIDESPRCVARDYCCTAVQKCDINEGYCTKNEQCQSNVCGPSGSCNTEMCSKNMNTCFSNQGRCCIKGTKQQT